GSLKIYDLSLLPSNSWITTQPPLSTWNPSHASVFAFAPAIASWPWNRDLCGSSQQILFESRKRDYE
ncbi:hypothetical protein FCV25MIE_30358, partial [Fagus crenata]